MGREAHSRPPPKAPRPPPTPTTPPPRTTGSSPKLKPQAPASAHSAHSAMPSAMPTAPWREPRDAPEPLRDRRVIWWVKSKADESDVRWDFVGESWVKVLEEAIQAGQTVAVVQFPYAGGKKYAAYRFDLENMTQTSHDADGAMTQPRDILRTVVDGPLWPESSVEEDDAGGPSPAGGSATAPSPAGAAAATPPPRPPPRPSSWQATPWLHSVGRARAR